MSLQRNTRHARSAEADAHSHALLGPCAHVSFCVFLLFVCFSSQIGLYLAAGLMAEIACITLWSADYTGAKRYDNSNTRL